jgi:FkbM family methyltransferase
LLPGRLILNAASFFRRARIAGQAVTDIANWSDVLPRAARGKDVTEIRLRSGPVITAPAENALWPHFSDIWYHLSYTKYCSIPQRGTVVDVGANVGVFSLFASRFARCVYSLEPASSNFSRLRNNILLANNVFPIHSACGPRDEKGTLDLSGLPVAFSLKTATPEGPVESVDVISLATLFQRYNIPRCDYLKLDCEGAEFEIILDSSPLVFNRIHQIVLEYHDHLSDQFSHHDLAKRLQSLGFKTIAYNPHGTCGMMAGIKG